MLKHYFRIATRSMLRYKSYTAINIFGLGLGLVSCILIFLIVRNELSYDQYHGQADRTYRITSLGLDYNPSVSFAVAPAIRNDFPELEHISQYYYWQESMIEIGHERRIIKDIGAADGEFARIFDLEWLAGDPKSALAVPNTIVLTKSIAKQYFGDKNPVGEVIRMDNNWDLKVTGIIKDLPSNTHLTFKSLVSWETFHDKTTNFWSIQGGYLYVTLPEGLSARSIEGRLPAFIKKNWGEEIEKEGKLLLQPLTDIHYDQRYINQTSMPRSKKSIYGLAAVGLFILVIACINFVNIATAFAVKRSKEVGIRKVIGAKPIQIIKSALLEIILQVLMALILALGSLLLFMPHTENVFGVRISSNQLFQADVVIGLLLISLFAVLISGLYPALIQSRFNQLQILKSPFSTAVKGRSTLKKGLIGVQFLVTQLLIMSTFIVAQQMDFFLNKDIGFDKESIITFGVGKNPEGLRHLLSKQPGVKDFSFASAAPAYNMRYMPFSAPHLGMDEVDVTEAKVVDENYLSMFKIEMLAGLPIAKKTTKDSIQKIVVNKTFITRLGIRDPNDALGEQVIVGDRRAEIQGVVADFQSESKHKKIRACFLYYDPEGFYQASVKLQSGNIKETITAINKEWSILNPESLFNYEFLDNKVARLYEREQTLYSTFKVFTIIAIIISCVGLLGLVSLMAVQRVKEIGVRKVLGASVQNIVALFLKDFVVLILMAFVIAVPVAWYAMHGWLQEFAYQINIVPLHFIVALLTTLFVAGITVFVRSFVAATGNPIKAIKEE
ncbi:ABC transporter permease [Olivibacter domesticus]|uniref:FtsX-like permease family protein n=1 Tax=Olivibacter domesticus TaxID=407022 RepID=A0A1H7J995_OLID1|nr:ABC transporter permease [Olivibacter domesticus]SEK70934.1 FtsX-like permease family protein [Olivibacter domesticus]